MPVYDEWKRFPYQMGSEDSGGISCICSGSQTRETCGGTEDNAATLMSTLASNASIYEFISALLVSMVLQPRADLHSSMHVYRSLREESICGG